MSFSPALSDQHAVCAGDDEVLAARVLLDQLRERRVDRRVECGDQLGTGFSS
jgi:hypothetical protein